MDFQSLRKEYEDHGIDIPDLVDSPLEQLRLWMEEASQKSPGTWFEPNAMALATADGTGDVSVRVVLIKGIKPQGVIFFTNYSSFKGRQLDDNPRCSAVVHWPYLNRQVRFSGRIQKSTRQDSEEYFRSRPRQAQLSASVSAQSEVVKSRSELEDAVAALLQQLGDSPVPVPENWGGYWIAPQEFEFWQGRTHRLHDRIAYRRSPIEWVKVRLAP